MKSRLVEGVDYYVEDGKYVFTEAYHLKRGYCCNSRCRHCPYRPGAPSPVRVAITGLDVLQGPLASCAPRKPK